MLLENIYNPQDLHKVPLEQLLQLAIEVRERMVDVVSRTGGHLASSLGAVELIIALHYCLDMPADKIIFDVGHQAYAHKLLTGRNTAFETLRQFNGISGFPSKDESVYDSFTTGHSSSAVSLALGLAAARDFTQEHYKVVAVIGDGSLSGGLCFEGLNNAGHLKKDILVVLNTNELSIAPNVGAISTYLNKIISLPIYNRFKDQLESFVRSRVPSESRILKLVNRFEEGLKGLFVPGMLFEEMGFRYFGPLDGHDLHTLIPAIKNILYIKGPRLLHVITKKGKGYSPSENDPVRFHGTGPFEVGSGRPVSAVKSASVPTGTPAGRSYTDVFGDKLVSLAKENKKIIAITAAMPEGTGLDKFRDAYPQRFFDVGIAEAHAVCFASGLARAGLKPVIAVYSTFLQRAYDQIIEDVALQNTGVVFVVDRAGIVGEDGATHQGIFDLTYLRNIPNLVVMAPKDGVELEGMLEFAMELDKPVVIRYPRSTIHNVTAPSAKSIELGKSEVLREGKDFAVIALGSMVEPSLDALELLAKEGLSGTLVNARFAKPLDVDLFKSISLKTKKIFTIEEGIIYGGFGSAVNEVVGVSVVRIGLPDEFIPHGKRDLLLEKYGLNAQGIADKIKSCLK
ncbi:MAG: 1-deoxy-D-xylulose-5-phosphate synthase [Candidatus Omnitrophica bacterium]|nr:1-deoxy-D-xylulose-5-phosphate synthase [Candidatus Omnitrophota bacterium]